MQSRVKRQRGSEEMLGQIRSDERRDNVNISHLIDLELRISRKSKKKIGKEHERDMGERRSLMLEAW